MGRDVRKNGREWTGHVGMDRGGDRTCRVGWVQVCIPDGMITIIPSYPDSHYF